MRGEAKKGCPQMTQMYADGSSPLAGDVRQLPEIHLEFFICAHLRHLRIKNSASPGSPDCPAPKPLRSQSGLATIGGYSRYGDGVPRNRRKADDSYL